MNSSQFDKIPKPICVSLNALLREFQRCSNLYFPLFHERFIPTCDLSDHSTDDICRSFRNANSEHFDEGWEEWDGPASASSLERFYGCEDGLCEFRKLGDSIRLVVRELDPSLPDTGYLGWLDLLYEMAWGYPTPLLRCTVSRWNERATHDLSEDELDSVGTTDEEGVPFPLYPLHFVLPNNLFTSSVVAIELMLDDEGALLIGEWTGGFPISFPSDNHEGILDSSKLIVSGEDELQGPIKSFVFLDDIQRWAVRHELGNEVAQVTFEDRAGCNVLDVLFRHPNEWLSASRLLQLAGTAEIPTPEEEAALNIKHSEYERFDVATIREYRKRIVSIEQDLRTAENPERRQELEGELAAVQRELRVGTDRRGKPRPLGSEPDKAAISAVQTQLIRCRNHIAMCIPEFPDFCRRCLRRSEGEWIYEPDR